MIQEYLNSVDKFIIIGDRVLIKPREMETHTKSGLVLPGEREGRDSKRVHYQNRSGLPDSQPGHRRTVERECIAAKIYGNAGGGRRPGDFPEKPCPRN